jgi:putative inorganic carbon (hco3(-)) transporter
LKLDFDRSAFYLTGGALVSILFSIAVSQILLALALAALLVSSTSLRLPPIKLPLALFMAATVISLLASGHIAQGMPQIRKFYVFFVLLVTCSTFRKVSQVRAIVWLWAGVATLSAARSFFQFWRIYRQSQAQHVNFYDFYVGSRITGFMSHWMTFGAEEMIVLLLLLAYLFFSGEHRWKRAGWLCAVLLACSMVLGFTRSIFLLGFPVGLLYLLWFWKKWLVAAVPAVVLLAVFLGPHALRERVVSVIEPQQDVDSNQHRAILRETGLLIVRAHPWLGLGPEQIKYQIDQWIPASARPLPPGDYEHLHNVYLQYAAERGIPALLIFLWLIAKILWDFANALRRKPTPEARFVLHGAIAALLALLAEGFAEYNLGDSEVLTLFLAVVAFGYTARDSLSCSNS